MKSRTEEEKTYKKPEVRKVELSLAEVTLGSGCNIGIGSPPYPSSCGTSIDSCDSS